MAQAPHSCFSDHAADHVKEANAHHHDILELDLDSIPSPTLARLVEEVRNDDNPSLSYNRTYHRHNR